MSLKLHRTCDGCGAPGDSMERTLGLDYCAACQPEVKTFMEAVSDLHTRKADAFKAGVVLLREQCKLKETPY